MNAPMFSILVQTCRHVLLLSNFILRGNSLTRKIPGIHVLYMYIKGPDIIIRITLQHLEISCFSMYYTCLLSIGTRVKDGIGKSLVYATLARGPVHVGRENPLQTVYT